MRLSHKLCLAVLSGLIISNAQAADYLADRHQKLGTDCTICHGPDKKDLQTPSIENCQQCHPIKALVEKTKDVKPKNPHFSPHYQDQLDCVNCHYGHEKSENFCDQCHKFGFKVP